MPENHSQQPENRLASFFRNSGLPRDVVPNMDQILEAMRLGTTVIDHLTSRYAGRPATVVLYNNPGGITSGVFEGPELDRPIRKEIDLRIIPCTTHPGLGVLALVASTGDPQYDACYFLKESR